MKDYFYIALISIISIMFIYSFINLEKEKSELRKQIVSIKKNYQEVIDRNNIINEAKDECLDKNIPDIIFNKLFK
jgi:hypothetical protein